MPVEERKGMRCEQGFFDELHIATLMAAPSVGRRSCAGKRKAAALIVQSRRFRDINRGRDIVADTLVPVLIFRGKVSACRKNKEW